jgi:hypothetical protein
MSDALLKLCDLWKRRTRKRQPYLAGAIGGLKLLIFKCHDPGEDGPHWSVFLTARSERREQPTRNATRDRRERAAPQADPVTMSAAARAAYAADLARQFDEHPDNGGDLPF